MIKVLHAIDEGFILAGIIGTIVIFAFFIGQILIYHTPSVGLERTVMVTLNKFGEYGVEKALMYFAAIFGTIRLYKMVRQDTSKLYWTYNKNLETTRMMEQIFNAKEKEK